MLDIWTLEPGQQVQRVPDGRMGTVVEWESTWIRLDCGCCDTKGPDIVDLTWNDNDEREHVEAEDLRTI